MKTYQGKFDLLEEQSKKKLPVKVDKKDYEMMCMC